MKTCDKLLNMKRITTLKAKLKAAKQELRMRKRTSNSATRAYNKVVQHINILENKIANLAQIPKSDQ
jgi:hypothetical protein